MIGVLLLSHGRLAEGVHHAVSMIAGSSEGLDHLGLEPGTTSEVLTEQILAKVNNLNHGLGVLLITDIIGGTPFNAACMMKKTENVEILAGLNLGMALTASLEQDSAKSVLDLALAVEEAGLQTIRRFAL